MAKDEINAARGELMPFFAESFAPFRRMASDIEAMFEGGWPVGRPFKTFEPSLWAPNLELFEKDHHLVAKLDLPGMKQEEVSIEVAEGRLAVRGERKREEEIKKDRMFRSEREYGSFYRSFALPEGVDTGAIRATMANGVLEIVIPLPNTMPPKVDKVPISVSSGKM